ncbi:MAG: DUF1959 family protein [Methanobrevibacter sp.]|uniref:DUF1959 family protein n=1 Tax=Methanobrevibacter sp. TaxID=66852 RepID=UPI001B411BC0|nr:DUF1959 family protein [Methanobrevibacter sp.]MBP3791591.1 DUF1959 family protein [Methanobrevibacter sp.]
MDDESKMILMKERILGSYAWQRDIIDPLSKDFECTPEELKEVFFKLFDMSTLEAFHGTFDIADRLCLSKKFHADLRLCWFVGYLNILTEEEGDKLKEKLVDEVKSGKSYEDALKEGQLELFDLLKEKSEY